MKERYIRLTSTTQGVNGKVSVLYINSRFVIAFGPDPGGSWIELHGLAGSEATSWKVDQTPEELLYLLEGHCHPGAS